VTFALYPDQEGGSPLWLETQNVSLDPQGRYTALLGSTSTEGLPLEIFSSGEARWLGIQVQGQAEQPRVLLVAVPYALKAAEAETLAGHTPAEFILSEQLTERVQEEIETQVGDLDTRSVTTNPDGTKAITESGVKSTFTDTNTTEVVFVEQLGTGRAIRAKAINGPAVRAFLTGTTGNPALLGETPSSTGQGVAGFATATSGLAVGVVGRTASAQGSGVVGLSTSTTGATVGVRGEVSSPVGRGVVGLNNAGSGPTFGVQGRVTSPDGLAVIGQAVAGSGNAVGVRGETASAAGSAGEFSNSAGGDILRGFTSSGTRIFTVNNDGVKGVGGGSASVLASIRPLGVWGDNTGSGPGVLATNNASEPTLEVQNHTTGSAFLIAAFDENDVARFTVDMDGNMTASGTKSAAVPVGNGRRVALFAVESPENWFEDFGSGRLVDGEALIVLDPRFTETVNTSANYHVFLTPNGECGGLYVAQKTPQGFRVRELGQGESNVSFDYRIVARRKGYESLRLPELRPGQGLPVPSSRRVTQQ